MSDETIPGQLEGQRKRQLIRFIPDLSAGTIIQIISMLGVVTAGWAQYQSDRATTRMELDQVKAEATREKSATKETLADLKVDVKTIQTTVIQMDKTLAIIQANQPKGK